MKNILCLCILALFAASCTYTVYDMNKGVLSIPKKDSYQVKYSADIPAGTTAVISYTDKGNVTQTIKDAAGKWEKAIDLPSGQEVTLKMMSNWPKQSPQVS